MHLQPQQAECPFLYLFTYWLLKSKTESQWQHEPIASEGGCVARSSLSLSDSSGDAAAVASTTVSLTGSGNGGVGATSGVVRANRGSASGSVVVSRFVLSRS